MKNELIKLFEPLDILKQYWNYDSFRGFQYEAISAILNQEDVCFYAPTSLGKCFRGDTNVLMYDGTIKNIKDIAVGDQVMGPDSSPRNVLTLAQGREKLFEIKPIRGNKSYYVTGDHILCLRRTEKNLNEDLRIRKITVNDYIKQSKTFKHLHKWFKVPVKFSSQDVPIDPYFLGVWLGDGTSTNLSITTIDEEIKTYLYDFISSRSGMYITVSDNANTLAKTYHLTYGKKGPDGNLTWNLIRGMNLSKNKFIPQCYKSNSEEVRLQILAGLLDTDGSLDPSHTFYDYCSKSKQLCEDVIFVAQSLGFYCSMYEVQKTCTNNGVRGTYWRTFISGDLYKIPTKIKRKQCLKQSRRTNPTNIGFNITDSVEDNYYGFTCDGDHMFLLDDFSVVHNSVVYQVSALCVAGTTIVISPLIALMSDQVEALKAKGIQAEFYNSSLTIKQSRLIHSKIVNGDVKLLYCAPETLLNSSFIEVLQGLTIPFIFLDEAHVCSSWGHDFRSDYKKLGVLRDYFPDATFTALTATADYITRDDIEKILKFKNPKVFLHSFDRPSITYSAYERYGNGQDQTLEIIKSYPENTCGIVYCFTRAQTEAMAAFLSNNGVSCLPFHAGLKKADKEEAQSKWMSGEVPVISATIAFGMGIDKGPVRFVIHATMPSSLEGYSQESGRASRDGLPSHAYLLHNASDVKIIEYIMAKGNPNPAVMDNKKQKLRKMYSFANGLICRRYSMLDYFGEKSAPCGNCDVCNEDLKFKFIKSYKPIAKRSVPKKSSVRKYGKRK